MYYQVYNTKTGRVLVTCPDFQSAIKMIETMGDPNLEIRPIEKSAHPLARK